MIRAAILLTLFPSLLSAADLHVSLDGNDTHPGSKDKPFASLGAARDAARAFAGKEAVNIHVADGTYHLPETLVFGPEDSGSEQHPITYRATNEGGAVLSGGLVLETSWTEHENGIFKTSAPEGIEIDQVFIEGKRQDMARYPNRDPEAVTKAYQGFSADAFSKERAKRWKDPAGGYIHAMHVARWGGYHYKITGKDDEGEVTYEGGWQNNRRMGMHKDFRMVENIFEELDAPGEWFHDAKTKTLYYFPHPGTDLSKAKVEVVRLRHLVELNGSEEKPVRHLTFDGFIFRHTARTFMDTREPLLRSDWAIYRGGAVFITGGEDITITNSEFDQPGGNGIFVNHYNRRITVKGCHIHDTGGSGVCFVGDPNAVRDPLFEYKETNDLTKIDRTPGPKTNNYPSDSVVEDCLIHGIGRVERQPAGVQISMAARIKVLDSSIYDCARAGINVSEGTWGGHLIDGCDVFDTVQETHDHGSFNSWGRDRFWHKDRKVSQKEIDKDPKLPYLDAMEKTIIRNSRWRCDHGWDIDLDDGSSNYEIYNNLMLAGGLKFREGFGRHAYNNVLVNNGFHPHVWYQGADSSFQRNIAMRHHSNIGCKGDWNTQVDHNFYTSTDILERNRSMQTDADSSAGNPKFLDPAAGDFRVPDDSPALAMGFKNFPMDQFGVKKPSLQAITATPEIPELQKVEGMVRQIPSYWLGASLHSLGGEEFSAFGVSKEDGGVQLKQVPAESRAAACGLQEDDLIQKLNGLPVRNTDDLFDALGKLSGKNLTATLVRNQQAEELALATADQITLEGADSAEGLKTLQPKGSTDVAVTSKPKPGNAPLKTLHDGKLAADYGPVFANNTPKGFYLLDLGKTQDVQSLRTWTFNQGNNRAALRINLLGSNAAKNPGMKAAAYQPIGTIDTRRAPRSKFEAAALSAPSGSSLGEFRWILVESYPLNDKEEHPAIQEIEAVPSR